MKKFLLFGGTFDPIHHGHIGLLNAVKDDLLIDDVFLIPTKNPPWKVDMASIDHRLKMIHLAVPEGHFHILDYELEQDGVNYTIDTVRHFKGEHPADEIFYLIGADQAELFHKWKEAEELARLAQFVVYGRPGYGLARSNIDKFNMMVVEGRKFEVSSTKIRSLHDLDTPWPIIEYIIAHDLYFTKKLKSFYDDERFAHVVSVAKLAHDIAESNHLATSKAVLAALLHDIAKRDEHDKMRQLVLETHPDIGAVPSFSVHQYAGAIIAKREFGIEDEEVLDAIRYHASAKPNMNPIGEVLYAADKIEPLRGFDSQELIAKCMHNYHQGFIAVLRANYEYHKELGKPFKYDITAQAMAYYLEDHQ